MQLTNLEFNLNEYRRYSNTFIETGVGAGDGVQRAIDAGFDEIASIELSVEYYKAAVERFKRMEGVEIFLGKSIHVLPVILQPYPCVIFLDAHPCGRGSAGHDQLMAQGPGSEYDQDVILKSELAIIGATAGHVIIIDDQQGINPVTEAYAELLPGYTFAFYNKFGHQNAVMVCLPA